MLGDFTSVSATLATQWPTVPLVAADGTPTGETVRQTGATQIAFSGVLKSGAVASLHFRAGQDGAAPGQTPFVWLIDGETGSLRVESQEGHGSFIHVGHPRVLVKGEEVPFDGPGEPSITTNVGRAWEQYAKGDAGHYSTFEDAVRLERIIHAIRRSADEGRRITL